MMEKSKVSVILPMFNVAGSVEVTLEFPVNQTLRDMKVISVNVPSPDSSGQILDRNARDEPRLKVIRATNYSLS